MKEEEAVAVRAKEILSKQEKKAKMKRPAAAKAAGPPAGPPASPPAGPSNPEEPDSRRVARPKFNEHSLKAYESLLRLHPCMFNVQ